MVTNLLSQGSLHEAVGVECSQYWIGLSSTELFPFMEMMPLLTGTSKLKPYSVSTSRSFIRQVFCELVDGWVW